MRWDEAYFGTLGLAVFLAGSVAILRGIGLEITDPNSLTPILTIAGSFVLWRGFVLASAGWFYVYGTLEGLGDREHQAMVFMGSLMIWILAGTDLLGRVLETIPGGSDVWIASAGEILAALGPPYAPSLVAAPLALVALVYLRTDAVGGGET